MGLSAKFNATSWGLRGNVGLHLNLGPVFLEPGASLSYVDANIDDYAIAGGTVRFDDVHSLRGSVGLRVGGDIDAGRAGMISPYVGLHAVHDFEGQLRDSFTLGQTIALEQDAPGTFGQFTGGVSLRTGTIEAFVRSDFDFGSHRNGLTGRAGVRLRF